jgi:hypothetical protein
MSWNFRLVFHAKPGFQFILYHLNFGFAATFQIYKNTKKDNYQVKKSVDFLQKEQSKTKIIFNKY